MRGTSEDERREQTGDDRVGRLGGSGETEVEQRRRRQVARRQREDEDRHRTGGEGECLRGARARTDTRVRERGGREDDRCRDRRRRTDAERRRDDAEGRSSGQQLRTSDVRRLPKKTEHAIPSTSSSSCQLMPRWRFSAPTSTGISSAPRWNRTFPVAGRVLRSVSPATRNTAVTQTMIDSLPTGEMSFQRTATKRAAAAASSEAPTAATHRTAVRRPSRCSGGMERDRHGSLLDVQDLERVHVRRS